MSVLVNDAIKKIETIAQKINEHKEVVMNIEDGMLFKVENIRITADNFRKPHKFTVYQLTLEIWVCGEVFERYEFKVKNHFGDIKVEFVHEIRKNIFMARSEKTYSLTEFLNPIVEGYE